MRAIAVVFMLMLAPAMASSLTVAVDRRGEPVRDLALLAGQIDRAYNFQKRYVEVRNGLYSIDVIVGDADESRDALAVLDMEPVDRDGITVRKNPARAFWFRGVFTGSDANQQRIDWSTRLYSTVIGARSLMPGLSIEADGDGAVLRSKDPGFAKILYWRAIDFVRIKLVSPGVWHTAWQRDVPKRFKSKSLDKMLAQLFYEPHDLMIGSSRDSSIFVFDDTPGNAAFFSALRAAFADDPAYSMRETAALRVQYSFQSTPERGGFTLGLLASDRANDLVEAINPAITTRIAGDHVQVRAVTGSRAAERMAVVRKLLRDRSDLIITESKDHGLDIRLKPGTHLLMPRPAVDDARLAEAIRARAAALKLGPVTITGAGPERAVVGFAEDGDAAAFRQALDRGPGLTVRLVDEDATPILSDPEPGDECPAAADGSPVCLQPGVILSGDMVADAKAETDTNTKRIVVMIGLTDEGRELFAAATRENVGKRLAIVIDGMVVTAPTIQEPIEGGQVQITGSFTLESAGALAAKIMSGRDGVALRIVGQAP